MANQLSASRLIRVYGREREKRERERERERERKREKEKEILKKFKNTRI